MANPRSILRNLLESTPDKESAAQEIENQLWSVLGSDRGRMVDDAVRRRRALSVLQGTGAVVYGVNLPGSVTSLQSFIDRLDEMGPSAYVISSPFTGLSYLLIKTDPESKAKIMAAVNKLIFND